MIAMALMAALVVGQEAPMNPDQIMKSLPANMRDRQDIKDAMQMATMKKPEGCSDKCDLMQTMMKNGCEHGPDGKKKSPTAAKKCEENAQQMIDGCKASCRDKGKIDKDYIKSKVKMPSQAQQADADAQDHD